MYLVLGDNHAMSADSRDFGFVPENNLRGGGTLIFWPIGKRFGTLPQPSYPWFTLPNFTMWFGGAILLFLLALYVRKKKKTPIKF